MKQPDGFAQLCAQVEKTWAYCCAHDRPETRRFRIAVMKQILAPPHGRAIVVMLDELETLVDHWDEPEIRP